MANLLPVNYLHHLAAFVQTEYNLDLNKALDEADCPLPEDLSEVVDYSQFSRVWEIAASLVNDPVIGLKYGRTLSFTVHGALGAAMMSCKKVSEIFELAIRFETSRFPFQMTFIPGEECSSYLLDWYEPFDPMEKIHSQVHFSGGMSLLLDAVGYIDKRIAIDFPHPHAGLLDQYQHYLPVNLRFDQKTYAMHFPNEYLNCSLPKYDEASKKVFINMCEQLQNNVPNSKTISQDIQNLLDAYEIYPSMEQVAKSLGILPRSLRSRLQNEGTSFRKLVTGHRVGRAKSLLTTSSKTIETISEELGYSDPANFNRAFKKETGVAPHTYRQQQSRL